MTSRRRFVAGFAALTALTGTLVFAGAISAQADGGLEITTTNLTWTSGPTTIQGTADGANQGVIEVRQGTDPLGGIICSIPWAANWSCNTSLPVGSQEMTARQALDAGQEWDAREDTTTVTVGYPSPNVTSEDPHDVVAGDSVGITGTTTYPNVTIRVTTSSPVGDCTSGTPIPTVGTPWSCSLTADASVSGDFDLYVEQLVGGTPIGAAWMGTLHVDAATFAITSPPAGDVDWTGTPVTISGFATDTATPVSVFRSVSGSPDPIPGCQNLSTATGTWSCTATFTPDDWDIYATQGIDTVVRNGYRVLIPAPGIDQSDPRYTPVTADAYFSGTTRYQGTSGSYVQVYFATPGVQCSSPISWNVATQTGTWSCPIDMTDDGIFVDDATYTYTVRQEDLGALPFRTATHTLIAGDNGPPPLNCSFVPSGVTITDTYSVDKGVYRLTPYSGGGAGGGGSDGGDPHELAPQGYCNGSSGYHDPVVTEWNDDLVQSCGTAACALTGLAAGIYEVYFDLPNGGSNPSGYGEDPYDYLFRIPETPAMTAVVSTANSVVVRGTATAGDAIRVVRSNGSSLCTTTATGAGTWACQFPKSSASTARAIAVDPQSSGLSAYTAARSIPVFVAPLTPPVAGEPPIQLVNWFLEFGGDLMGLRPGDSFTLNVSGMPEGTEIEIWMHSTPVLLGTATGTGLPMVLDLTVPENIESGPHEIEMIGVTPLGTHYFSTSDAMVIGGTEPGKTEDKPDEEGTGDAAGGGAVDRTDPSAPSALSEGLAPLSAIAANPATIAIAGGLALALLFLVALPTELLNSSLSSNTSRLGRAYGAFDDGMTKAQDWLIRVTRSRAIAAGILVVLVAIIYGFIDPGFGFDIVSVRLVLSLAIALFLLSFVASWISGMIIRRAWGAMGVVAMQPSILLFAVVGVIVARVLDFSPGFLVGIAIGLELLQASKTVTAKAVFVQIGVVTGLALAAWVAYSFFTPGNDFFGMLVEDTLVAVTAEGLTGALIAVFPLKFLDGRELWEVSKRLWVAAFLIVAVAFALLVLPTAIEGTDVADYGTWLLVFAVFGLGSLAVWLIFVRAEARAAKAEADKVDA